MNWLMHACAWTAATALVAASAGGQIVGGGGGSTQKPAPSVPGQSPPPMTTVDTAAADRLLAEGKYPEAVTRYSDALRRSGGNAPLAVYLGLGDAQNAMAGDDMIHAMAARVAWETAMKQYPRAPEPRQRLLKFYVDYAEISGTDTRLDLLRRASAVAGKVLEVEPADEYALLIQQRGIIEPYLFERAANQAEVIAAIDTLKNLQTKYPNDINIPFFIARAQAKIGTNALKFGNRDEAATYIKAALTTMDQAIARQPKNAGLLFRKAQVVQTLGAVAFDLNAYTDEQAAAAAQEKAGRELAELLAGAVGMLGSNDPELTEIVSFAVRMQRASGNDALAETILRTVLDIQPGAAACRIQLAELLIDDPPRSAEALEVLAPATTPPTNRAGIAGMVTVENYRQAVMMSANLRIDLHDRLMPRAQAGDAAAKAQAEQYLKQAAVDIATLQPRNTEPGPRLMRLQARYRLASGDTTGAIQQLEKTLPAARELDDVLYCDMLTLLGKAYVRAGDTAAARKQFETAISRREYAPARIELVRLLIDTRQMPETRPHLEKLRAELPADPAVQDQQARLLQWEGHNDRAAIRALLDTMPEDSITQKLNKIGVSARVGEQEVALRLVDSLSKQFPGEARVALIRVDVLVRGNDRAAAIKTLQEFNAAQPNHPQVVAKLNQLLAAQ